jgi:sec-independent protein translocase protein TatA
MAVAVQLFFLNNCKFFKFFRLKINALTFRVNQLFYTHKIIIMLVTNSLLAIFLAMPGGTEWIFILLAVVLLFGGKKIPELMKGIGKGVRDFNDAKETVKNEMEGGMKSTPATEKINSENISK